jgi:hypothetical protein
MPAYTSRLALPYPQGTDPPNGPGQIESLANVLDTAVGSTLIASQVLSVAEASVTFSAIPQVFNHLSLKVVARSTHASEVDTLAIQFNGDTAGHYDVATTENSGGTIENVTDEAGGSAFVGVLAAASATSDVPSATDIEIPCYALTVFEKAFSSRSGYFDAAMSGADITELFPRGLWRSTAAITQIVLFPTASSATFAIGSAFYLYGLN